MNVLKIMTAMASASLILAPAAAQAGEKAGSAVATAKLDRSSTSVVSVSSGKKRTGGIILGGAAAAAVVGGIIAATDGSN